MYRYVFAAILGIAFAARTAPAQTGQLDASPTLFTVMAALDVCGYNPDAASPNNHPLRGAVRGELQKRDIPSLAALKEFFAAHRRPNDTAEISQYISFALSVGPPPAFAFKMRDVEIPPDVSGLAGLPPLLTRFYQEAGIQDLWNRSQRAIEEYIATRYHAPVTEAVLQANVYLRQQTSGFSGRQFQIFIELLGVPNQVHTRSYGNEYTIVITPSPSPKIFEVRHAYLTYLLDPLATRNQEVLMRKKAVGDHARRARLLADQYKDDFLLLTTASLVKAVEARLDKRPQDVGQALLDGYVLAPYFAEQLPVYERQEASMLVYYKEMAGALDLVREDARLTPVAFNTEAAVKTVKVEPPAPEPVTGGAKTLEDAERLYKANDFEGAKKLFLGVLQETDVKRLHGAAYYGLGRIAVRQNDPETGERLLQKALEMEPEPWIKAWTLVFLGRLSLAAGEKERANQYFNSALIQVGASEETRKQAQLGIEQSSKQ